MVQVLLIDDDISIQDLIRVKLGTIFDLIFASSLLEARQVIQLGKPDLIILDEKLPDGLGSEFLEKLRNKYQIPVIMLTSEKDIVTKRKAFLSGAVDYITKPFDPEELILRIDARINLVRENIKGDLFFDFMKQKVSIEVKATLNQVSQKIMIDLTPAEFKILHLLVDIKSKIYNRSQIIENVWGADHFIDERTIDQHISKIRKKIKDSKVEILSKHGQGYLASY